MLDKLAPTITTPGSGRAIYVAGDLYTFLVEGHQSGGSFALWHAVVPPGGGPPPHIHSREDEAFYVLKGQITFFAGGVRQVAGPGNGICLPRGGEHAFRNETAEPAETLIMVTPAGFDQMMFEVGKPVTDRNAPIPAMTHEDVERLLVTAPRYGVEIKLPH